MSCGHINKTSHRQMLDSNTKQGKTSCLNCNAEFSDDDIYGGKYDVEIEGNIWRTIQGSIYAEQQLLEAVEHMEDIMKMPHSKSKWYQFWK